METVRTFLIASLYFCCDVYSMDISQKYLSDVSISCHENSFRNVSDNKEENKFAANSIWLLPNGDIVRTGQHSDKQPHVYSSIINETSVLHVNRIDDIDFGVYWCVEILNDSSVVANKHTINIDGPPMHEFYEQQRRNAIVGAISAGALLGIILITYIVWHFQCSEKMRRKRRLTDDLAKGINRYSTQIYDNVGMELYVKRTDK